MGTQGPHQQKEPVYQVTYHSYLAGGGQLSHTLSVEHWRIHLNTACLFWKFCHFPITPCSREKRCQALPTFPYCKWQKAGRGLGTKLLFFCICVLLATSGFTSSFIHVTTVNSYWIHNCAFYPSSRVSTTHHQENNCIARGQKNDAAGFGRSRFVDTCFFSATYYPLSKLELDNRPHVYSCRSSEHPCTLKYS